MGEHLRPPYSGKFYIRDNDGKEIELNVDFITELDMSREVELDTVSIFDNAMRAVVQTANKLTIALTALGEMTVTFKDGDNEKSRLPDDAWETMILNGIHN